MEHLSEQEQLRRQSLKALRDLGINPYPAERFDVSTSARCLAENFDADPEKYQATEKSAGIIPFGSDCDSLRSL